VQVATNVAIVDAGGYFTLFVKTDGSLWSMGANDSGQLGDGTVTNRRTPVPVATGVIAVSAGVLHSLFIKSDASLWSMGRNFNGQLGNGSTSSRSTPGQIAAGVASVSAGFNHTLFVKTDGTLWGMGRNHVNQLDPGSLADRLTPLQIATGVVSAAAGGRHSVLLVRFHTVTFDLGVQGNRVGGGALVQSVFDGAAPVSPVFNVADGWALKAWSAPIASITSDLQVDAIYVVPTAPVIGTAPASASFPFSASARLSVAATGNAPLTPLVYQWYRGEPGNTSQPVPGATGPLLVIPALRATADFWVRISNAGVYADSPGATVTITPPPVGARDLGAMGYNFYGQLGDGSNTDRATPTRIATDVAAVSASSHHTVYIKSDDSLWAMGSNSSGQLGDGSAINRNTPVPIATGVASASAGGSHTLFVKTDASLWMAGGSGGGTPRQIATGVASASAGYLHSLFLNTDGTLWAFGNNSYGQLGDGTETSRTAPVPVASDVVFISAGGNSS
jgi:hypothetical protein